MARELVLNASLAFTDAVRGVTTVADVVNRKVSPAVANKKPTVLIQNVGIIEEVLNLGDCSGLSCVLLVRNLDPTNYVEVRVGTGSTKFAKLRPDTAQDGTGGFVFFEFGSGVTAPYIIADTAACDVLIAVAPGA